MKRVTISRHKTIDSLHLDVFFETDLDYLLTYEISNHEAILDSVPLECFQKQNHRQIYLDYEGEISNDRGMLEIVWKGYLGNDQIPKSERIVIEVLEKILNYREKNSQNDL